MKDFDQQIIFASAEEVQEVKFKSVLKQPNSSLRQTFLMMLSLWKRDRPFSDRSHLRLAELSPLLLVLFSLVKLSIWQCTMHNFVEDLEGVEVITDGFLIAGFGTTEEEVVRSLTWNERAFLEKCREWQLKLNRSKVKHQPTSVRFMGHLLTSEGLKADPDKVRAILDMPEPEHLTALKRFMGMVTYLLKFMPHLSNMTTPLRRLEDRNTEFQWASQHTTAMNTVKKFLVEAPVLRYYNVRKPVTVQCDASQLLESNSLVYRGEQLVGPLSLRKDMLHQIHRGHIGIGGCGRV